MTKQEILKVVAGGDYSFFNVALKGALTEVLESQSPMLLIQCLIIAEQNGRKSASAQIEYLAQSHVNNAQAIIDLQTMEETK